MYLAWNKQTKRLLMQLTFKKSHVAYKKLKGVTAALKRLSKDPIQLPYRFFDLKQTFVHNLLGCRFQVSLFDVSDASLSNRLTGSMATSETDSIKLVLLIQLGSKQIRPFCTYGFNSPYRLWHAAVGPIRERPWLTISSPRQDSNSGPFSPEAPTATLVWLVQWGSEYRMSSVFK